MGVLLNRFMEKETWKAVVGFENGYEVSSHGRVRSIDRTTTNKAGIQKSYKGKLLNLRSHNGYKIVNLSYVGLRKTVAVHRMVALAFLGVPPDGYEVCHRDGCPSNNMLSNLRWDSPYKNSADKAKHGTVINGSKCHNAILSEDDIPKILADGRIYRLIAEDYGVVEATIGAVKTGLTWKHIST